MRRRAYAIVVWCALAALATLAPVPPAWGHAEMDKSNPAGGAQLTQSPTEIRAWFSEKLALSSIMRLYDVNNTVLAVGGVDLKVQKHDQMRILPPLLRPGTYEVRWYAVSDDDGAVKRDSFKFSVVGASLSPSSRSTSSLVALAAPSRTPSLLH